jgi:ankyrin repeat protein/mono/diheme cytochrome c family protein
MRRTLLAAALAASIAAPALFGRADAQEPAPPVDFVRDVQPIFRQSCYGCHGPTQRMGGFRLDRRSDAMRGGTIAVIGPGNSAGSRLYLRLIGSDFGAQMPLTGTLKPEQVATIRAWIDQGANWPDSASGETPLPPLDPAVQQLMSAALHGDTSTIRTQLDRGVNPNARNHAGATALMWAIADLEATKLLLDRGADPNAKSDEGRTPLMIAAGRSGGAPVVRLLLDRGADVSASASNFLGATNALNEAAYTGDEQTMRLLIERGADPKSALLGIPLAIPAQCPGCAELLLKAADRDRDKDALNLSAMLVVPPFFDGTSLDTLIERGADLEGRDAEGRTLLMLAASSDFAPAGLVRSLLARGADVNATSKKGETALSLASLRGRTPVVDLLVKAGARGRVITPAPSAPPETAAVSIRAAVERSLPLLQKNAISFREKSGCVSCHNNSLTAFAVATARAKGVPVHEPDAKTEVERTAIYLSSWRDKVLQGIGIAGDSDTIGYLLFGLAAEQFPANEATDAMARFLARYQAADGHWRIVAHRPPIESSDLEVTAVAVRALQAYAPATERAAYERVISRAAAWIAQAQPRTLEDRTFQLLGLAWTSAAPGIVRSATAALVAQQHDDGGWSQLSSLPSDAYATGQALVALRESGLVKPSDKAYARGLQFLLRSQAADGSWHVPSRAIPIQPFFESGFPYGRDQFVSAAATGWATAALAAAVR